MGHIGLERTDRGHACDKSVFTLRRSGVRERRASGPSVTPMPDTPALGPLVTLKPTVTFASPLPAPSRSVAASVAGVPAKVVNAAGLNEIVAVLVRAAPIGRHCIDSLCVGEHDPASMPPVSKHGWCRRAS
jgi:hypothetical protein